MVVGGEGPGRSAAGNRLHDRRFHLHEAPSGQKLPQRGDYAGAALEHLARFAVHDEVHVTAPIALFAVGQPVKLLRQWPQGLGEQRYFACLDAQLAGSRADQLASRPNDVTQIHCRGLRVGRLAEGIARQHQLYPPAGILNRGKAQAAHPALRHEPAGHLYLALQLFQALGIRFGILRVQLHRFGVGTVVVGKRPARFAQRLELAPALGDQAMFGRRLGGPVIRRRGHDSDCTALAA